MNEWLPRVARILSLVALALTFFVAASLRASSLAFALLISVAAVVGTFLVLWQGGGLRAWWVSAGVWGGLSYLFEDASALVYLVAAVVIAFSAYRQERLRGRFELTGPLAFIGAVLALILLRALVSR